MLGSSQSIADPNITLNTIVAEELAQFADILEKADDFKNALASLIKTTINNHKRIIFNGDGYSDEWRKEAETVSYTHLDVYKRQKQTIICYKIFVIFLIAYYMFFPF